MARGEGAEPYSAATLLPVKPISPDGIKVEKNVKRDRLSVLSKICFAVGGAPYQITGSALGFFLQIYLLDVVQMNPFYASIILFVGRAWDAVTDPTVGFLVSRSRWTWMGRMMPWVLFSTPFAVMSYFLIWCVPPLEDGRFLWYLLFYCLFQSMQTCFHVPYSALTMFISSDQKERDSATAYRMTVEVLGTVIGTAIQGQIVGGAVPDCISSTPDLNMTNLTSNVSISEDSLDETKRAYMVASGVISGIYVTCAAVLFLGVKEKKEISCTKSERPISFVEGLRLVTRHGPYVRLVMGVLFTSLAFMLLEGNFAMFCTYTLGFREDFHNVLLAIMISATLSIPLWQWFLTRFGKKTAVYVGISLAVPFMIITVTVPSNLPMLYIVALTSGSSVAVAFLLPWSMLPDAVDDFKLKNPDCHGHEAIFYSFYVFFIKFASGVSLGISTLSLDIAGYVTRVCTQTESVNWTLKVLVGWAPVVLIVLGLLIFRTYPINEKTREANRKLMQELWDSNTECETPNLERTTDV